MAHRFDLAVFSARGLSTYALTDGKPLIIGRGEDADIRVDDTSASRLHARFDPGPPLVVEDLGSANGTFVAPGARGGADASVAPTGQQERVPVKRMELSIGDSIFVGACVVVVRSAKAPEPPLTMESSGAIVIDASSKHVYEEAARIAATMIPVLILGETGVGKDVLARFIHRRSPRASKPFVALDCAAISETLADSQLFGHERSAFTGADQARAGVLESAAGGTVFLDEIGELSLPTQARLLRALESGEIERVGSSRPLRVDIRLIAATNRDLEQAARLGSFRRDLFFRVGGATLRLPPLRERRGEIVPLVAHFLDAAARAQGKRAPDVSDDARDALVAYGWPGNVRELRWVIERALVSAGDAAELRRKHLPDNVASSQGNETATEAATKERVIDGVSSQRVERRNEVLQLAAIARGDRDATTARVRDAFGEGGAWITDVRFFSGVQTVFAFECAAASLPSLERALTAAGLTFDDASRASIARASSADGEFRGTLAVTFAHGDPDLKHEVPEVPG